MVAVDGNKVTLFATFLHHSSAVSQKKFIYCLLGAVVSALFFFSHALRIMVLSRLSRASCSLSSVVTVR